MRFDRPASMRCRGLWMPRRHAPLYLLDRRSCDYGGSYFLAMTAFEKFLEKCKAKGLQAFDFGNGHWQIRGGAQLVNWYPTSKKRSIYIDKTSGRISFSGTEALAIEAAIGNLGKEKTKRTQAKKKIKARLLRKDPRCFKCKRNLTFEIATLDHIIPLAKGGTNKESNFQLACEPCNLSKADHLDI